MIETGFFLYLHWVDAPEHPVVLYRAVAMPYKVELGEKFGLHKKDILYDRGLVVEAEQTRYNLFAGIYEAVLQAKPFERELERDDIADELIKENWAIVKWDSRLRL